MFKVLFIPDLKSVDVEAGTTVIEAAEKAGVLIDASCNGNGTCGKCKVRIRLCSDNISVTDNVSAADIPYCDAERKLLSETEISGGYHLACCTSVNSDMEITVPATHGGSGRKKKMVRLPERFAAELNKCKACPSGNAEEPDNAGSASGDTDGTGFGIAFDIGTTTVVGMLWNLATGELVDVESRTNYQTLYGADVISRIQYSIMGEREAKRAGLDRNKNLETLQTKVIQCCNDILGEICDRNDVDPQRIGSATAVGNTTMSHIFVGVNPRPLSRMPFAPVFKEAQDRSAAELGINISDNANVHLLPNIAGHVGSDIVGMMMAAGMDKLSGSHIAIDIGTNGEVVAVKDGKMVCCSTAAGPAFEGATIHQGMRAAAGAIEKVTLDADGVHLGTIDDAEPIGICGSGLIDAVSELLRVGVVDQSGHMLTKAQARDAGIPDALAERIVGENNDAYFVLSNLEENEKTASDTSGITEAELLNSDKRIVLTQADIREVQLAKGAILAGIQTLMHELGMTIEEIDSIMLAGAFGNYIDKKSALGIGLLPQVDEERIVAIGNAAGVGSCMALLSDTESRHADELALATEHIELSMNPTFQEYYIEAMKF